MADPSIECAVCAVTVEGFEPLAEHFVAEAACSDIAHVMWLNRNVTKYQVTPAELAALLAQQAQGHVIGAEKVKR